MGDLLQTRRTFKTRVNAIGFLHQTLARAGVTLDTARYVIAVNDEGRFAPVLFSSPAVPTPLLVQFAHVGVTVVG